jgi:hypothetical protein
MPDTLAKAMADRSAELVGTLVDIPFPDWENANAGLKEFWREMATTATSTAAKQPDKPKAKTK